MALEENLPDQGEITELLVAMGDGDPEVMEALWPMVYDELRGMARGRLRGPRQTLDTTTLVHEAYLKLVEQDHSRWQDRLHFLRVASVAMRHILVDHARRRAATKRGGDEQRVTYDEAQLHVDERAVEILALDAALTSLAELDPRLGRLVELRFFGGLTVDETAAAMEISARTVKREWRKARAFLFRALDS